jgi:hypothetical protein
MKDPNRTARRIEAVRRQLERLPPPPKTTLEVAEEEQLWERACYLYEHGEEPRSDSDPRLLSYFGIIRKYAPALECAINEGLITPRDDGSGSTISGELADS